MINTNKIIRKIARLLSLPVVFPEMRKHARNRIEAFLHRFFKTEYFRCEQIVNQVYQKNKKIGFEKYHLISLGKNCFGRMFFTFWGLKPRKAEGEKTMPFDITIHPLKTVIQLLQTHFQTYFNDLVYSETYHYWTNPSLDIQFPHDFETDKSIILERYKNRIQALDDVLADQIPCLFFAYTDTEASADEINALNNLLAHLCAHKKYKLIYMVFNHPLPFGIDENIAVYQADYPKGYVHMDKYTKFTKPGLSFELPIAKFIYYRIKELI